MSQISYHIDLQFCASPQEAPTYDASSPMLKITKVIIVEKGTNEGNATVDIQLKDSDGNEYVIFTTGALLEMMGQAAKSKREMIKGYGFEPIACRGESENGDVVWFTPEVPPPGTTLYWQPWAPDKQQKQ